MSTARALTLFFLAIFSSGNDAVSGRARPQQDVTIPVKNLCSIGYGRYSFICLLTPIHTHTPHAPALFCVRGAPTGSAALPYENNAFSRYAARVYRQPRGESIANMRDATVELLDEYARANSQFPNAIVMYRDGVSEGEFEKVMRVEVDAMKEVRAAPSERDGDRPHT